MISSSGIKRGLAATAVSALAVAGLPFLANSASAVDTTLDVTSRDGAAFDLDEFDYTETVGANAGAAESDIVGQINNETGNAVLVAGRTVNFRWVVTPFDGIPAGTDSGQTNAGTVTTDNLGKFSVPRPVVGPIGDLDGTWELFVSLADDGAGPGNAIPERKALTVKAGDSTLKYDETSPEQATSGTSETVSGSLKLADGTALAGRSVTVTYNNGNVVNDANIVQADGTTAATRTVTTDAAGNWSVVVRDPAATPQPEENGTITAVTADQPEADATADVDNPTESADSDATTPGVQPQAVQFIQSEAPAAITITPDDNGLDTAGETQGYTVNVKNAAPESLNLNNVPVTLTIDHGYFTDGIPQGSVGGDFGVYDNDGQTITVTTDGLGNATFNVAIGRDAGFDDNGLVTGNIKATAGSASNTETQEWTSANPLNGGAVDLVLSPVSIQESGVLPKAPLDDSVLLDVLVTDQFGNAVGGQPVVVTDNVNNATVNGQPTTTTVTSDFALDGDVQADSDAAQDQVVTGTWVTDTETLVADGADAGTAPDRADGPDETLTDSQTINWYAVDFANSTFTMNHSGDARQRVGSTVTETYTALDQFGEPISDLFVTFFRTGPDLEQDGDGNANGPVGQDGTIQYVYQGTTAGSATVEAVGFDGVTNGGNAGDVVENSKISDTVTFFGTAPATSIAAKLQGSNNGAKADRLKVNAPAKANGAVVKLYKIVNGSRKLVKTSTLNLNGNHKFKVADKNGKKFTKYVAKVVKTSDTKADTTNNKRVR